MASQSIQIPSVCIPRVMYFITEDKFHEVFTDLFGPEHGMCDENGYGPSCLKRVDMVMREDTRTGEPYFLVFLHFNPVDRTPEVEYLVEKIKKGDEVKIEYDQPWFWKLRKNVGTRTTKNRPRIIADEEKPTATPPPTPEYNNQQESV